MENTPLNKAHETGRQAVKLLRRGLLSEAAECHIKAASILQGLENKLDEDSLCKRSLEEQVKFHQRQAHLTRFLKEFVENEGTKPRKMADLPTAAFDQVENRRVPYNMVIRRPLPHPEIQKNFDEADSLLQILSERKLTPLKELQKTQSVDGIFSRPAAVDFLIRPRNDAEVIEELQTVNLNLRALVDKLLNELNESREENRELKQRLEIYENTGILPRNEFQRHIDEKECIVQIKPSSEILTSAEVMASRDITEIPELDPLEDPEFDFSEFSSHQ